MALSDDYDSWCMGNSYNAPMCSDVFDDERLLNNAFNEDEFFDFMPTSSITSSSSENNMYCGSISDFDTNFSSPSLGLDLLNENSLIDENLFSNNVISSENSLLNDTFNFWDTTDEALHEPCSFTNYAEQVDENPKDGEQIERYLTPLPSTPIGVKVVEQLPTTPLTQIHAPAPEVVVVNEPQVINCYTSAMRVVKKPPLVRPEPYNVHNRFHIIQGGIGSPKTPAHKPLPVVPPKNSGTSTKHRFQSSNRLKTVHRAVPSRFRNCGGNSSGPQRLTPADLLKTRKVVLLRDRDPITGKITETYAVPNPVPINNNYRDEYEDPEDDDDENWELDMPTLTREAPFQPEQIIQPVQRKPKVLPVDNSKTVLCKLCSKLFSNRHSLSKHMHSHDPPRYRCSRCSRLFYDRVKLRRHFLSHYDLTSCQTDMKNVYALTTDDVNKTYYVSTSQLHQKI